MSKYLAEFLGTLLFVYIILATGNPNRDWYRTRSGDYGHRTHFGWSREPGSVGHHGDARKAAPERASSVYCVSDGRWNFRTGAVQERKDLRV